MGAPQTLFVRNLARNKAARTTRAMRTGGRRTGVLLSDGTRLRRKGRRTTELDFATFQAEADTLLGAVEDGFIEIYGTDEKAIPLADLRKLAGGVAPKAAPPPPEPEPEPEPEPDLEPEPEPEPEPVDAKAKPRKRRTKE